MSAWESGSGGNVTATSSTASNTWQPPLQAGTARRRSFKPYAAMYLLGVGFGVLASWAWPS